ncbi:lytic transglycosylase domain-containing protein [Pseudomonas amygdali pv. morsprunorum]|uniref:lytic transglycosylase domain-containing protein n=1 Tax=Pseudomonas amygdali TaxID=47877 RepID=UPI002891BDB1|nr:lytic transglycosylase domain-containing protein [Pseudomonas amygdali]MDT3268705.1 lytic transglycosylase domain-containing protein [Pseudomonas amygdali pv. morsprunorum]
MIELAPLLLACAASVHPDTVKDVAWVESRMNPYAIGVVDGAALMPANKNDALTALKRLDAAGKSYSVGLMQIHQSNFTKYDVNAEKLFDPCTNLAVFEKVLTDCYVRGKTLSRALSCYYSGNFETGNKKEKAFSDTSYVQRIFYAAEKSYVVPSTHASKMRTGTDNSVKNEPVNLKNHVRKVYPSSVIKNTDYSLSERPTKLLRGEK